MPLFDTFAMNIVVDVINPSIDVDSSGQQYRPGDTFTQPFQYYIGSPPSDRWGSTSFLFYAEGSRTPRSDVITSWNYDPPVPSRNVTTSSGTRPAGPQEWQQGTISGQIPTTATAGRVLATIRIDRPPVQ